MNTKNVIFIGIAGASASGKTLLANTIVKELDTKDVEIISEDAYYKDLSHLTLEDRKQANFDHPDSLDRDLMIEHLDQLKTGVVIEIPTYDFAEYTRAKTTRTVGGHRIIILEGILLFTDKRLRDRLDIAVFMDTPLDICLLRRLKRDMLERERTPQSIFDQYMQTVRPMYKEFIEPSKAHADITVPRGGANRIAIDILKAKIRELLGENHS